MNDSDATFEQFWEHYVRAHSNKLNRTLHAVGTGLALACLVAAIFKRRAWPLFLAPVFAYGLAWCGHFFVEKNLPTTFSHPLYSARAGLLMFWKTVCGQMDAEVARVLERQERAADEPRDPSVVADALN